MVRLLAIGGILLDLATTAGSLTSGLGENGMMAWLAVNASLLSLPVAYRFCELLATAVHNAPEVLTVDVSPRGARHDS